MYSCGVEPKRRKFVLQHDRGARVILYEFRARGVARAQRSAGSMATPAVVMRSSRNSRRAISRLVDDQFDPGLRGTKQIAYRSSSMLFGLGIDPAVTQCRLQQLIESHGLFSERL